MKFLFRKIPLLQRLLRWIGFFLVELTGGLGIIHYKQIPWLFAGVEKLARLHIRKQVDDPEIQKKLTPQYTFFCKRPSYSNTYFKVFNQPNVELVTESISAINEHSVLSADGSARKVDILICATGFSIFERGSMPTFDVIGKGGLNLADYWQENRFRAYEGATLPGLPNYFMIMGPYAIASASYFGMIDTQVHHMIRCLKEARRQGSDYIEVKQAAFEKSQAKVFSRMQNTVFTQGDCALANSYYFDKRGDSPLIRPVSYFAMWWKSRTFSLDDYLFQKV
jgi:cation diffusion facilitator CzcD-associated flavoprotein CzcO